MERMQVEAEALNGRGHRRRDIDENNHTWGPGVLEFSAVGTAVVPSARITTSRSRRSCSRWASSAMADHAKIDLQASLARVDAGGIPLRAEQRLADEAGPHRKLFTSDLSVSEFLLARDAKCEPSRR